MICVDRRQAFGAGLGAILPGLVSAPPAMAQSYGPHQGKELAPGVREVFIAKCEPGFASYRWVWVTDQIFEPGAVLPAAVAVNDMLCHMLGGLLRVKAGDREFVAKKDDLWALPKGRLARRANTGAEAAIVRVIDLLNW